MRKLYVTVLVLFTLALTPALAQVSVGGGLALGTDDLIGGVGLDGRGYYVFQPRVRGVANIHIFFPGDPYSFWTFDANVHYLLMRSNFNRPADLIAYIMGGLNYAQISIDHAFGNTSNSEIGFNIGLGGEKRTDFGGIFGEIKIVLGDADQIVLGGGVRFSLN